MLISLVCEVVWTLIKLPMPPPMLSLRHVRRRVHRAIVQHLRESAPTAISHATCNDGVSATTTMPMLSALYGRVIHAKRSRELANSMRLSPTVPVISVGNMTFGATGKTPCVMYLTDLLLRESVATSRAPMLLTRGYGDDEWKMFVSRFPNCKLAIGADRLKVGKQSLALANAEVSCVVLDDGLQQWKIQKDLDIVMIDALAPFGNGFLIPHGSLRELPHDALGRADVVILHHANLITDNTTIQRLTDTIKKLARVNPPPLIATSGMVVVDLPLVSKYDPGHRVPRRVWSEFNNKIALVFCGVGNPASVKLAVEHMQCWAHVEVEDFADHHAFSKLDIEDVLTRADTIRRDLQRDANDIVLLTTEKDYARSSELLQRVFTNQATFELRVIQSEFKVLTKAQEVTNRVKNLIDRDWRQEQEQ